MFKVVPDQLKVSGGWVRCGHCAEVFDARLSLVEPPVLTTPAPALPSTAPATPPPVLMASAPVAAPADFSALAKVG